MITGRNLWELIEARAADSGDAQMAVDEDGRTLTFAEYRDWCERAAAGFQALGLAEGDVVSWQLPTWFESMVLVGALARIGVTQNPIIPIYREREVGFVTKQAGSKLLVVPSVFRGFDDPPFSEADRAWMNLLVPHLSRSLGLMHRLGSARLQSASLLASLDRLAFGVVLLNEHSEVLHLNRAAQVVVDRLDGLSLRGGKRLEFTTNRTPTGFSRWLSGNEPAGTATAHFSECFLVPRTGGKSHYALQRSGLPATPGWFAQGEDVRSVAFITDPAAMRLPDEKQLFELYGFTPSQSRVARELATGGSYDDVADRMNISVHTVRAHAKTIYAKARVNRQSDLVRSILSLGQVAV